MPRQVAAEALVMSAMGTEDEEPLRRLAAAALGHLPAQTAPMQPGLTGGTDMATAMQVDQQATQTALVDPHGPGGGRRSTCSSSRSGTLVYLLIKLNLGVHNLRLRLDLS